MRLANTGSEPLSGIRVVLPSAAFAGITRKKQYEWYSGSEEYYRSAIDVAIKEPLELDGVIYVSAWLANEPAYYELKGFRVYLEKARIPIRIKAPAGLLGRFVDAYWYWLPAMFWILSGLWTLLSFVMSRAKSPASQPVTEAKPPGDADSSKPETNPTPPKPSST